MISGDHRDGPERTGAPAAVATKRSAVKKGLPLHRDVAGACSPIQIATPRRRFGTLTDAQPCAFLPAWPCHPEPTAKCGPDLWPRRRPLSDHSAALRAGSERLTAALLAEGRTGVSGSGWRSAAPAGTSARGPAPARDSPRPNVPPRFPTGPSLDTWGLVQGLLRPETPLPRSLRSRLENRSPSTVRRTSTRQKLSFTSHSRLRKNIRGTRKR